MRFHKVIYIRYIPLTEKVYKDFYMGEVESAGISVEYWDISALFFKNEIRQEDSSYLMNTRKFNNYRELEDALVKEEPLTGKLFVSLVTFEGSVSRLYKLLTKYKCKLAVFGRNMFPLASGKNLPFFTRLVKLTPRKILDYLAVKKIVWLRNRGTIKRYDIVFLGGNLGWQGIGNTGLQDLRFSNIIKVNSDDYDRSLSIKLSTPLINEEYILFLDEYLPLHPDTILFKIKNISKEQYYPELCEYFDRVEKQFGKPVIIAAHPKAQRYKEEDFFNGRKVYFGRTAELSYKADFVIAHDTTSINYPIAFNKKIHFITSKNIEKEINIVHQNVLNFAKFLGCNMQWFDRKEEINLIEELPYQNYQKYKYEYQTSTETENKLSKDVFIAFLKNEGI